MTAKSSLPRRLLSRLSPPRSTLVFVASPVFLTPPVTLAVLCTLLLVTASTTSRVLPRPSTLTLLSFATREPTASACPLARSSLLFARLGLVLLLVFRLSKKGKKCI